jgi:hypothetical protein
MTIQPSEPKEFWQAGETLDSVLDFLNALARIRQRID